jgi:hypothetical protein
MPAQMHTLGYGVREVASLLTRARFLDLNRLGEWGRGAWDAIGASDNAVLAMQKSAGVMAEQARSIYPSMPAWPTPNIFLNTAPVKINPILWGSIYPPLVLLAMAAPYISWAPLIIAGGSVAQGANSAITPAEFPGIEALGGPVYEMLSAAAVLFPLPNPANIPGFSTTGLVGTRGCCKSCESGLPCETECAEHVH